jgi:hypothetical protein
VTDPVARGAARLALAVALPCALVAGLIAYLALRHVDAATAPGAGASPGPQSTSAVAMSAPTLPDQTATICRALLSQLPDQVRGRSRRPVTAGSEQNAAYGDPAITLACGGVPQPSIDPTADVYLLSGVCWYAAQGSTGTTWSTLDRQVPVTVTVPSSYDQPGQWVTAFSGPIVTSVPSSSAAPTGCRATSG